MQSNPIVNPDSLARPSPEVAPDLLGCTLCRQFEDGIVYRAMIVETEAYAPGDPACHAYRRKTPRNAVMFGPAGYAYVYFIYGMYSCLNIVTDLEDVPSAVLIRAIQLETIPPWIDPRHTAKPHRIGAGPGKLCRALKIDVSLTGQKLAAGEPLWLENRDSHFQQDIDNKTQEIIQTTRIGISVGVDLPWRWYLANSPAVSRK